MKLLLIDTSGIEYSLYRDVPHLIGPIITNIDNAINAFRLLIQMMDDRYDAFSAAGVKDIESYNRLIDDNNESINNAEHPLPKKLPYIIVMIDNLAALIGICGKEGEEVLQQLIHSCSAAGIFCILSCEYLNKSRFATDISHAFETRISFARYGIKNSEIDLGIDGAEKLLGEGEFLLRQLGDTTIHKVQCAYLDDEEISKIVTAVKRECKPKYDDYFVLLRIVKDNYGIITVNDDPMFEEAKEYVIQAQKASTSLLQRRFGIGYNRAARMIDALEENGIIGSAQGSKPREVFVKYNEK